MTPKVDNTRQSRRECGIQFGSVFNSLTVYEDEVELGERALILNLVYGAPSTNRV